VAATPAHRAAVAILFRCRGTGWDETRFLRGEIGAYVVVARCRNRAWQVGGITGAEGRVLTVRLEDFLENPEARRNYALEILARILCPAKPRRMAWCASASDGVDAMTRPVSNCRLAAVSYSV